MSEEQQVRLNVHTEKMKGVVTADMLERIAMTPRTAKRLTLTLIQSLREYEARFGEIAVEEKAPEEE